MSTPQTITLAGQEFTYEGLFTLSGPELAKIHNTAAPKAGVEPTKRFSDKVSAVKRTWAVLQKVSEGATVASAPSELMKAATPQAKPTPKAAPAPKVAKERKKRGRRFVWKPLDEIKKVRPGTFRATLVELLSRPKGATFSECLAATWATKKGMDAETADKTCYEAMRLLHNYVGYGMRHLDDSADPHIQIYTK